MCGLHANAHRYVRRFWRGFKAFLLNIPHLAHLPCFVPIFLPSRKMPSLRLFFPVLLLTPLTTSLNLPLTFTQPSPNPSNSTPHLSLPLTLPPSANVPTPNVPIAHCTTGPYWHLPTFNPKDCQDALNSMYVSAVKPYGNDDFEFVTPGAHPYHTMRVMETPRRYASGMSLLQLFS